MTIIKYRSPVAWIWLIVRGVQIDVMLTQAMQLDGSRCVLHYSGMGIDCVRRCKLQRPYALQHYEDLMGNTIARSLYNLSLYSTISR